ERRDPGDEQARQAARTGAFLELRVEGTDEAGALDDGLVVELLPALGEQAVGEAVVLVDEQVELVPCPEDGVEHRFGELRGALVPVDPAGEPVELGGEGAVPEAEVVDARPHAAEEAPPERV